ncbi:MAG: T9SS type A sorting domain-containing protein [Rubricoccaceae bacterium]|nr:T9SS type A sorting domain-containing protein [Rubricoccaceae bacterium]
MCSRIASFPLLVVAVLLFGLSPNASAAGDLLLADAAPGRVVLNDTVTVFVVWGSSNMINQGRPGTGEEPARLDLGGRPAWEWFLSANPQAPVVALEDPIPARNAQNASPDPTKGSLWHPLVIEYYDATGNVVFMTSAVQGATGPTWMPPDGVCYLTGTQAIDNAMAVAEAQFGATHEVVFGGVVWNLSPGLSEEYFSSGQNALDDYPWSLYRVDLRTLLAAYGDYVSSHPNTQVHDGRFYLINTIIRRDDAYYSDGAVEQKADFGLDLEADVCSEFAFCSMVQESGFIKAQQEACGGNGSTCGGWYSPSNDPNNTGPHWGQAGLNHLGAKVGEVLVADRAGAASPWAIEVEVPQAGQWCASPPCPETPIRLDVYDDTAALVGSYPITPSVATPDWTARFDGSAAGADVALDWGALGTAFVTLEFVREETGADVLLGRYAYVPPAVGTAEFFQPSTGGEARAVHFDVGPDAVAARSQHTSTRFEDVFADAYVLPYNYGHYDASCTEAGCPAGAPDYFLARLPLSEDRPDAGERRFTFAAETDVNLTPFYGALTWDVSNLTLAFAPDRRLYVKGGDLTADGVRFTAAQPSQGWGGLRFDPASVGVLTGVTVERVVGPAGDQGDAAVEVYDADVLISESFIQDGTAVHGVWASGKDALLTLDQSFVQTMGGNGAGVVAAEGAEVHVYDSFVLNNGYVGAGATGTGSTLYLYRTEVSGSGSFGVVSEATAEVNFYRPGEPVPSEGVTVGTNLRGGLFARAGGDIVAGVYNNRRQSCTAACQNFVIDNWLGGNDFDARASGKNSALYAEYNFWGVGRSESDLEIVKTNGGKVFVAPLWDGISPRIGGGEGATEDPRLAAAVAAARAALASTADVGQAAREARATLNSAGALGNETGRGSFFGDLVASLVESAAGSAAVGDSAAASGALLAALLFSSTEEDHGLSYGKTSRFLGQVLSPELTEFLLLVLSSGDDDTEPWALSSMLSAYATGDDDDNARTTASTLTTEYADSDHELAGLTMTARLAAEDEDLPTVQATLAELEADWGDLLATESVAALARRLEDDLMGGRVGGGHTASAAPLAQAASATMPVAFRLLRARPNPFTGRTVVPFEVSDGTHVRVSVFDILGREVAVLADGRYAGGVYEATLEGRGLAAGLYVVTARVETPSGARRTLSQRVTLLR